MVIQCGLSVYRGKNGEVRSSNGLGYDIVFSLLQEYFGQGYSLYIDNFYTSPILVKDLFGVGVHATGLDCTRTGVPAVISSVKSDSRVKRHLVVMVRMSEMETVYMQFGKTQNVCRLCLVSILGTLKAKSLEMSRIKKGKTKKKKSQFQ